MNHSPARNMTQILTSFQKLVAEQVTKTYSDPKMKDALKGRYPDYVLDAPGPISLRSFENFDGRITFLAIKHPTEPKASVHRYGAFTSPYYLYQTPLLFDNRAVLMFTASPLWPYQKTNRDGGCQRYSETCAALMIHRFSNWKTEERGRFIVVTDKDFESPMMLREKLLRLNLSEQQKEIAYRALTKSFDAVFQQGVILEQMYSVIFHIRFIKENLNYFYGSFSSSVGETDKTFGLFFKGENSETFTQLDFFNNLVKAD